MGYDNDTLCQGVVVERQASPACVLLTVHRPDLGPQAGTVSLRVAQQPAAVTYTRQVVQVGEVQDPPVPRIDWPIHHPSQRVISPRGRYPSRV